MPITNPPGIASPIDFIDACAVWAFKEVAIFIPINPVVIDHNAPTTKANAVN